MNSNWSFSGWISKRQGGRRAGNQVLTSRKHWSIYWIFSLQLYRVFFFILSIMKKSETPLLKPSYQCLGLDCPGYTRFLGKSYPTQFNVNMLRLSSSVCKKIISIAINQSWIKSYHLPRPRSHWFHTCTSAGHVWIPHCDCRRKPWSRENCPSLILNRLNLRRNGQILPGRRTCTLFNILNTSGAEIIFLYSYLEGSPVIIIRKWRFLCVLTGSLGWGGGDGCRQNFLFFKQHMY